RLASGARRPATGAAGARHVRGLRRARRAASPARPLLAGPAPPGLGAATVGAPAAGLAPVAAGGEQPRVFATHPGRSAGAAADGRRRGGPGSGGGPAATLSATSRAMAARLLQQ